jgi:crotonobetainyl-CoA:carnitine CoA-transferase CaiB-like acyl-CoA transferase
MDESGNASRPWGPALDGLLVADFSRVLAGPLATMLLADFGARVIKIEHPLEGDATRGWGPPFTEDGESAYYLSVNRNKESVTLNLNDSEDRAAARRLSLQADVLVENFRPGTMERLGLDYGSLQQENPGLVYCSIHGIGRGELPGYDFLAQAVSGLMSLTGVSDGPPLKSGVPIVDVIVGLHAMIGILTALQARTRIRQGQRVSVDLLSSALSSLVNQASNYLVTGIAPARLGNAHPNIVPYQTFETGSGRIAVAVGTDKQFADLCEAMDFREGALDVRWRHNAGRVRHRKELIAALEARFLQRSREDWIKVLLAFGVPCGPINGVDEAVDLASSVGLDPVVVHPRPGRPAVATIRNPIHLESTPPAYRSAPPRLGEQTADVLAAFRQ